jgi:DNA-binding MarR family transcriptional regulator
MVVDSTVKIEPRLDLGYLALFLGLRVNELVTNRMHARGFTGIRESHGYVIQHLIEGERSITELARRMEVTQQAASKAIAELVRVGAVEIDHGADRRVKTVRLSSMGWESVHETRKIRRELEKRLIRIAGAEKYESARSVLSTCLDGLGGMETVRSRRIIQPK